LNYRSLVCLALIHSLVDCVGQFVSPLWPSLEGELGVAPWAISLLFAVWQTGASISQPVFGYLGDRFDTRWTVPLGPALAIVCLTLVGFAPGPLTLGLLLLAGGLGIGGFHPEAAVGVVQASERRITLGLAIFTFGGMVGLGLGPYLSGTLATRYGLQSLVWAALPGLLLVGTLTVVRGPVARPHTHAGQGGNGSNAILDGRGLSVLLLLVVATLRVVPALGVPWCLAFLLKEQGATEAKIGLMQSIFLLSGGAGTLLCPLFARAGRELPTLVGTTLLAAGFLALLPHGSPWQIYLGLIGSGFLLQGTIPILISYSQQLLPRGRRLAASLTLGASWGVGGVLVAGLKLLFPSSEHLPGMLWAMVPFALASSACAALLPRCATLLDSSRHETLAAPVRPEPEGGIASL
jgi:FSR family fosmidomycin resistance protein-like MFS transporter